MEIKLGNVVCFQTVPIPLHLLQTAEMLNSFVCYCGADAFVIVFNKIFKKLQMTHAEAYFAVSEDFKRSAEHSFVIATSDLCLCSRLTCEYSNDRDTIVASAAPLLPHHE